MKAIICVLATLITSTALAYKDGTYNCKVGDGSVPDRVVRIETISMSAGSVAVPFVEVTRSYKEGNEIKTNEVKGFASFHKTGDNETLMVAALRLDFVKDVLQNCNK